MKPCSGSRAGFTLVEVLITLLIISGIMVSVTQILNAARNSRDMIHNIQESQLAGPAIMDLVERDLRGLFPFDRLKGSVLRVENRVLLGADADSLDFITTTDSLVPNWITQQDRFVFSDFNEVGYRLRPNPNEDDFLELYRREGFGVDEEPFEGGHFTFLHERVKNFNILVFVEDGPDAEESEEWNADATIEPESALPLRVEISLTLELSPRVLRDQMEIDRRQITYKRVIRFPESLLAALTSNPLPRVPVITDHPAPGTGEAGTNPAANAGGQQK